jgi:serine/threonine-protein kinase RsbW
LKEEYSGNGNGKRVIRTLFEGGYRIMRYVDIESCILESNASRFGNLKLPWKIKKYANSEFRDLITEILEGLAFHKISNQMSYFIRLAVEESLANALKYGRRGNSNAEIEVDYRISSETFSCSIKDNGPGFDYGSLPDPTTDENINKEDGRGMFLIRKLMDKVEFNDSGNEITLLKRFANFSEQDQMA